MRKISTAILLSLVLSAVVYGQGAKGKDKGGDEDTVTVPEPSNVPELVMAGVGVGALMLILRRKMARN